MTTRGESSRVKKLKIVVYSLFLLLVVGAIQYGIWNAYVNNHFRWQGNLFKEHCIGYSSSREECVIDYTCGASHLSPPAKYYADLNQLECETTQYPSHTSRYVNKDNLSTHSTTTFQVVEFFAWCGVLILTPGLVSIISLPFLLIDIDDVTNAIHPQQETTNGEMVSVI